MRQHYRLTGRTPACVPTSNILLRSKVSAPVAAVPATTQTCTMMISAGFVTGTLLADIRPCKKGFKRVNAKQPTSCI
ncbi:unnamed protein product [Leptidea sinapis]|uniref:Uncharacterized protein n=1 Tax=Leptidea sinapis TaxID=189913 RepID=A0A5E4Q931_9NEOP|nr:unnamed protein product [Leptidea sinapis]